MIQDLGYRLCRGRGAGEGRGVNHTTVLLLWGSRKNAYKRYIAVRSDTDISLVV